MKAAGKSSDGKSCCLSWGIAMIPKPTTSTAISAVSPRLRKLSLASDDIDLPARVRLLN